MSFIVSIVQRKRKGCNRYVENFAGVIIFNARKITASFIIYIDSSIVKKKKADVENEGKTLHLFKLV